MCHACLTETNKIQRHTYPWLFDDMSMHQSLCVILPSVDELISAIRCYFNTMAADPAGEYVQFLESNVVHKAWSLLSEEVKHIQLDNKGSIFLCQCIGYDTEKNRCNHMFISMSKFVSLCNDCCSEK